MAIHISATRSQFFNELNAKSQEEYFALKLKKFMPTIDNLYYSVFISDDGSENVASNLAPLLESLAEKKEDAKRTCQPISFLYGLYVMPTAIRTYNIRLSEPDLYDIFLISGNLPNKSTNRIQVQLRAFGLWTRGIDEMLKESYSKVEAMLADIGLSISRVQENRIDYCYHTNIKTNVNKIFNKNGDARYIKTALSGGKGEFMRGNDKNGTLLDFYYYTWGSPASNNWGIKFYDKVKEVIEVGYKSFFFQMWYDNGLISFYDKFCFEYAFLHRDMDYIAKAQLCFYIAYGNDANRIKMYNTALSNPNNTLVDFKRMADEFMPPTTTVINIEYQTMREFYRRSDTIINSFKTLSSNFPPLLKRIYQVIDNRDIFLQYLHSDGFSFCNGHKENGKPNYLGWWLRLKNVKVDGIKADEKLLRDYAYSIDKAVVMRQAIRKVSTFSVYNDRLDTSELDDVSYFVSSLTDNQIHEMDKLLFVKPDGSIVDEFTSPLLSNYKNDKVKQNKQIKNRKKRKAEKEAMPISDEELAEWAAIADKVTDLVFTE